MHRVQISLTTEEWWLLDAEAARTGRSISALIRDAVSKTYGSGRDTELDLQAVETALGVWNDRDVDGKAYVERLRSGGHQEAIRNTTGSLTGVYPHDAAVDLKREWPE